MAKTYPPAFIREKVGDLKVVKDEVLPSALSFKTDRHGNLRGLVPIHSTRLLTLEDGSQTHGCRWCAVEGTLGEVRSHLRMFHGMAHGGAPRKDPDVVAGDGAVPDRRLPYPSEDQLHRTLWELLHAAEQFDDFEDAVTAQDNMIADLRGRLAEASTRAVSAEKELARLKRRMKTLVGE